MDMHATTLLRLYGRDRAWEHPSADSQSENYEPEVHLLHYGWFNRESA